MSHSNLRNQINRTIIALLDIRRNLDNPLYNAPEYIDIQIDPDEEEAEMSMIVENKSFDLDFSILKEEADYTKNLLVTDLRKVIQEEGFDKTKTH